MALDAHIGIGEETTYGALSSVVEGYEGKADSWKTEREFIESVGFRAGMQTARADRRNIVNMGGEGELEVDVLDSGAGSLFKAAFDNATVTPDGNGFRTWVFTTGADSASPSFSAQMVRPTAEGNSVAYKHVGCVATEWEIKAEVESAVALKASFDFQNVTTTKVPAEIVQPEYPALAFAYDWTRTALALKRGGVAVPIDASTFSLSGERGMKTDRRFLRGNQLKKVPVRSAMPTYEGEFEGEFTDDSVDLYDAFVAGELVELTVSLVGISDGTSMTIACPAIQFTGESPESSVDDVTTHNLPFRVLDPGDSTAAITVTYVEVDPDFTP